MVVVVVIQLGVALVAPVPSASAATVAVRFNTVAVVANPAGHSITGIGRTIDGSTAGNNFARIFTGSGHATGVVIDYRFTVPKLEVTGVQLFNNGGSNLGDADGIGGALVEVFDSAGTVIFSGPLTTGNGATVRTTSFPDRT